MPEGYIIGHIPAVETTGGPDPKVSHVRWLHHSKVSRPGPGPGRNRWREGFWEDTPVPQPVVDRMHAGLPKAVRRDPNQRYRAILERISADAIAAYRKTGRIMWPKSAEDELKAIAWREGDPSLTALGGMEQLQRQISALAKQVVIKGENKQGANDARRVTTGWHGH